MPMRSSVWGGLLRRAPVRRRRVGGARRAPLSVARRAVRRRRVMGRGFFGDIWSGIKRGVSTVAPAVWRSGLVGNLAGQVNPALGGLVKAVGGRRRRRRVVGRGMYNMAVPRFLPVGTLGGRRRRVVRRRRLF